MSNVIVDNFVDKCITRRIREGKSAILGEISRFWRAEPLI